MVMEYGTTWFKGNDDARLRIRIAGSTRAIARRWRWHANKTIGATPMRVALDASATTDADDDELTYCVDHHRGWRSGGAPADGRALRR
ncbi:MAG: hypothetical protein IPK33_33320 [Gemmatimonadetes bacterium]|nr:hypothetical protein [Gemmatimonadota bacterium]